jgi:hypothetical protein
MRERERDCRTDRRDYRSSARSHVTVQESPEDELLDEWGHNRGQQEQSRELPARHRQLVSKNLLARRRNIAHDAPRRQHDQRIEEDESDCRRDHCEEGSPAHRTEAHVAPRQLSPPDNHEPQAGQERAIYGRTGYRNEHVFGNGDSRGEERNQNDHTEDDAGDASQNYVAERPARLPNRGLVGCYLGLTDGRSNARAFESSEWMKASG